MTTNSVVFKTKEITASSRMSIKVGESYYTFEASETRTVDYTQLPSDLEKANDEIDREWTELFNTVNSKIDDQILDVKNYLKKLKK